MTGDYSGPDVPWLLLAPPPEPEPVTTPPLDQPLKGTSVTDYNTALDDAMKIDGALGVSLVDSQSGMSLAKAGNPTGLDLDVAAAGNSNVVRAKLATMRDLGINESIEDILITLGTQYHIIRPMKSQPGIFIYLVLDKEKANLAMARFKLSSIESTLTI